MDILTLPTAALDDPRVIRLCEAHRAEVMAALGTGFRELVEETSLEAVLRLTATFGGTEFWIPRVPTADSRLSQAIGLEAAIKLERRYGCGAMMAPAPRCFHRAVRLIVMRALRDQGWSVRRVARELGLHVRTVERALSATPADAATHA